jgi:uncharacterized tellurite resistance protein B-like protein
VVSLLSRLFGLEDNSPTQPSSDTETVRRIIREVDRLDPSEARYLAAFAFVLARVANSDMEISKDEGRRMEEIVHEIGGLNQAQAGLVVQIAKSQQLLKGGTENYLVTREFNKISDRERSLPTPPAPPPGRLRCRRSNGARTEAAVGAIGWPGARMPRPAAPGRRGPASRRRLARVSAS